MKVLVPLSLSQLTRVPEQPSLSQAMGSFLKRLRMNQKKKHIWTSLTLKL